nr:site-specific integrase [Gemmatimonadales bacterium]
VQVFAGLRPSETLALKWSDLDLTSITPQLRVRRTLYRPKRGGGWSLQDTKTGKSRRAVPLVPQAVASLVAHRDRHTVERLVAGRSAPGYDFVFADDRGKPLRADVVSKQWVRAVAAVGVPTMRLYDARHTCATLLLEAGEPLKFVQDVLGHSTIALTADCYSHIRPEMAHRAMARLAVFVDGSDDFEDDTDKTRTTEA